MSQHDMVLDNQSGASFRADLNGALAAIASNQSGSSEPNPAYPYQFWADTNAGVLKMRNAANTAWVVLGLLGAPNLAHINPGAVIYHAKNVVPQGFLQCNGAAVSRTTYAALFAEIGTTFGSGDGSTTFNVPELRGEFIRGWDNSRGVDAARVFGTAQAQDLQSHFHTLIVAANGGSANAFAAAATTATTTYNSNAAGGTETRPRNVALMAVIKY